MSSFLYLNRKIALIIGTIISCLCIWGNFEYGNYIKLNRLKYENNNALNANVSSLNMYNITLLSNNNLEIYIRSYVFDKRTQIIRFFAEIPMILIKDFVDGHKCIKYCDKYSIPSKWIYQYEMNLLYNDTNDTLKCRMNILTTAQRVWAWKIGKNSKKPMTWHLTHCQVFIECPMNTDLDNMQRLYLQLRYKYNHYYLQNYFINSGFDDNSNSYNRIYDKIIDIDLNKKINQYPNERYTQKQPSTIALCVSSSFHFAHLKMINSFIEHYTSSHFTDFLGGYKFHIYLYIDYKSLNISYNKLNGSIDLNDLFNKYYINNKVQRIILNKINKEIFFIEWNYNTKRIYFGSQILSIQDCIYRNMYKYEWILRYDSDEFLIIKNNKNNFKQYLINTLQSSFNEETLNKLNELNVLNGIYSYNKLNTFNIDLLNNVDEISFQYINMPISSFIKYIDNNDSNNNIVEFVINKYFKDNQMGSILTRPTNIVDQWVHYIRERIYNYKSIFVHDGNNFLHQFRVCKFYNYDTNISPTIFLKTCPVITLHFKCDKICKQKQIWESITYSNGSNLTFYEKYLAPKFSDFSDFN